VWLPLGLASASGNVLLDGQESRSRAGNADGSIIDEDLSSYVVTFDGQQRAEDWFAVEREGAAEINRVVFAHGHVHHDGGWFDASTGKPRIQVKAAKDAAWETAGELKDYPATTATDPANLKGGELFTLKLPNPLKALAIRVIGKPACGDNSNQAFASCAELQAFKDKCRGTRGEGPGRFVPCVPFVLFVPSRLLAYAELAEDPIQQVLGGRLPDDLAHRVHRDAQVHGGQFEGLAGA
jgi:hypothetical protein